MVEQRKGSVTRTMNEMQENEWRLKEMAKTNKKLEVLEKLERYREDKMMKEMAVFEEEKRKHDEDMKKAADAEAKRLKYL